MAPGGDGPGTHPAPVLGGHNGGVVRMGAGGHTVIGSARHQVRGIHGLSASRAVYRHVQSSGRACRGPLPDAGTQTALEMTHSTRT